jgi:hypothetical protein
MIRIAAVLFAAIVPDVPALADERISRAIEAASEMRVTGRNGPAQICASTWAP